MQKYAQCPSERNDCSNQFNLFQLTQDDHKIILYLELKVEDNIFTSFANWVKFTWLDWTSSGQTYNLDMQTMLEEDRQVKLIQGISIVQNWWAIQSIHYNSFYWSPWRLFLLIFLVFYC